MGKANYHWPSCTKLIQIICLDITNIISFFEKQAALARRLTVLSLLLQLVFPDINNGFTWVGVQRRNFFALDVQHQVASGSLDPASSSRPPKLVNLFLTPYYARQEYNRFYTVASLCDKLKLVLHIDIVDIVDEYALFFFNYDRGRGSKMPRFVGRKNFVSVSRSDRSSSWRHRGAFVEAGNFIRTPVGPGQILRHRPTPLTLRSSTKGAGSVY